MTSLLAIALKRPKLQPADISQLTKVYGVTMSTAKDLPFDSALISESQAEQAESSKTKCVIKTVWIPRSCSGLDVSDEDLVEDVSVDVDAFPVLDKYCQTLDQLQHHHYAKASQRGRHLFKLLKWSIVDSELLPSTYSVCLPELQRPAVNFRALMAALLDAPQRKLRNAIPILNQIIQEGRIGVVRSGIMGAIRRYLGIDYMDFVIDPPMALSALTSVLFYMSIPCRPGASSSGNHVRSQLWTKILSDAFSLHPESLESVWGAT
ncbi:hypothetical protein BC936DRAFT_140369 [Jimgerdemannia flammicorona]|uniref:Uncharacterized protein n=1 Tax=Jimgerdemannia flammicorona TaxID=994334 RepID=A0A433AUF6_9FUNG|nr:hypothetical protein BC936DRAFT_140369 [Jimgerdemannia flammicorona]